MYVLRIPSTPNVCVCVCVARCFVQRPVFLTSPTGVPLLPAALMPGWRRPGSPTVSGPAGLRDRLVQSGEIAVEQADASMSYEHDVALRVRARSGTDLCAITPLMRVYVLITCQFSTNSVGAPDPTTTSLILLHKRRSSHVTCRSGCCRITPLHNRFDAPSSHLNGWRIQQMSRLWKTRASDLHQVPRR